MGEHGLPSRWRRSTLRNRSGCGGRPRRLGSMRSIALLWCAVPDDMQPATKRSSAVLKLGRYVVRCLTAQPDIWFLFLYKCGQLVAVNLHEPVERSVDILDELFHSQVRSPSPSPQPAHHHHHHHHQHHLQHHRHSAIGSVPSSSSSPPQPAVAATAARDTTYQPSFDDDDSQRTFSSLSSSSSARPQLPPPPDNDQYRGMDEDDTDDSGSAAEDSYIDSDDDPFYYLTGCRFSHSDSSSGCSRDGYDGHHQFSSCASITEIDSGRGGTYAFTY